MIRVNLLRQQEKTQTNLGSSTSTAGTVTNFRRGGIPRGVGPRLAGFFGPILVVYIFNFLQLNQVENQIDDLNAEKQKIEAESQTLQPQLTQIAQYKAEKELIQKEVDEIKGLSLGRYKIIKILDTIQTIMPQNAWIMGFDLKGDTVSLNGNAIEDIAISSFIEDLDRSLYFKDISWVDSREGKAENGETVKMFKLSFKLENL